MFRLLVFTYSGCMSYLFNRKGNSKRALVFRSFFTRTNFITPVIDSRKPFICERKWLAALKSIWSGGSETANVQEREEFHLHNSVYGGPVWKKYLSRQTGLAFDNSFRTGNFVTPRGGGRRISATLCIFSLYPLLRMLAWSKRLRLNSLRIAESFLVSANLAHELKKKKIRQVFYTGTYDPEANYIAFYLMRAGIKVSMAVSGTPLFRFMEIIITNELLLTNAYQAEECEWFRETIKTDQVKIYPPLTYLDFIDCYKEKELAAPPGTVGVYTSGIWKRKEEGVFFDDQVAEKEKLIFSAMDDFLSQHPAATVKVFMHPVEKKKTEDYKKAVEIYSAGFRNRDRLLFAEAGQRTDHHFADVDLAVITVSNTIAERLFCGFKVLIVPFGNDRFPLEGTSLSGIAAHDKNAIVELAAELLAMPPDVYFQKFRLQSYKFTSFHKI